MNENERTRLDYRVKEVEFPRTMNHELMDSWAELPVIPHDDPDKNPEWPPTPVLEFDLSPEGLGKVHVKNEADRSSNPTGTMKDRPAWEMAALYRDFARGLYLDLKSNQLTEAELNRIAIPYFSVITSGNEGLAYVNRFERHNMPPPKLIIDVNLDPSIAEILYKSRAEIYPVNLGEKQLSEEDILRITNNPDGVSITSQQSFEVPALWYDWHVHENLNQAPSNIVLPFGSGRLRDCHLYWQGKTLDNANDRTPDPRLKVDPRQVANINIIAIEQTEGVADKLIAKFKPFLYYQGRDVKNIVGFKRTGKGTAKYQYGAELDEQIHKAEEIFKRHNVETEPSAAAALAGYLDLVEKGKINPDEKNLVINSGAGLVPTKKL